LAFKGCLLFIRNTSSTAFFFFRRESFSYLHTILTTKILYCKLSSVHECFISIVDQIRQYYSGGLLSLSQIFRYGIITLHGDCCLLSKTYALLCCTFDLQYIDSCRLQGLSNWVSYGSLVNQKHRGQSSYLLFRFSFCHCYCYCEIVIQKSIISL
jgi:hypothetical protein